MGLFFVVGGRLTGNISRLLFTADPSAQSTSVPSTLGVNCARAGLPLHNEGQQVEMNICSRQTLTGAVESVENSRSKASVVNGMGILLFLSYCLLSSIPLFASTQNR